MEFFRGHKCTPMNANTQAFPYYHDSQIKMAKTMKNMLNVPALGAQRENIIPDIAKSKIDK